MSDPARDPAPHAPRDLTFGPGGPGVPQSSTPATEPSAAGGLEHAPEDPLLQSRLENFAKILRLRDRLTTGGPPWATLVLAAANIGVFAWMVLLGGVDWWSPTTKSMIDWGANFGPLARGEEPWRLLTAMFLQVGILHLAMNMFALWEIGRLTERMFGTVGMLAMYFVTGLAGSVASVWWHDDAVAAGASGAIFGLLGGVFGATLRGWNDFPVEWKSRLWTGAWRSALFMGVLTYSMKDLDNAAHFGGLFSGMLFGALLPRPMAPSLPRFRALQGLAWGILGLAATAAVWANLPPKFSPRFELVRFVRADEALRQDRRAWQQQTLSDDAMLARIRDVQLPKWRRLKASWARLEAPPPPADEDAGPQAERLRRDLPPALNETADAVLTALDQTTAAVQTPSAQAQREMNSAWAKVSQLRQRVAAFFDDLE